MYAIHNAITLLEYPSIAWLGTPTESKSPPNGRASGTVRRSVDGGHSWEAHLNVNGAAAYSYSCLTKVPQKGAFKGHVGLAFETVLPGSAIKHGASANNIVFTLIPQNFTNRSVESEPSHPDHSGARADKSSPKTTDDTNY